MPNILILEQNRELSRILEDAMRELGYRTAVAADAGAALEQMEHAHADLIIADEASGGCELTQELRDAGNSIPVIVLVSHAARQEKRRVFRSGADGYMTLPPDVEELQMRVQNLFWRCHIEDDATLRFGECSLRAGTLSVETPNGVIELRRLEFLLLEKLLSYPGRVFTRAQLMDDVWGYDNDSDPRTVDTHVRRLRKKLSDVDGIRIQTVRGLGYRAAIPRKLRNLENR